MAVTKRYMKAYSALYGNGKISPPKKKNLSPLEEDEQFRLVNWMDDMGIRYFSVPNGRSSSWEGAKYRRLGAVAGVPDLIIPYKNDYKGYGSLYIELKRVSGGVISPEQKEWIEWLNSHGQLAVVARGFDEAKTIVEEYLSCYQDLIKPVIPE